MNKPQLFSLRSAMIALGCALCLGFLAASTATAADAPSLPVTATTLKLSVTITPSVVFHADAKVKTLPEHPVEAGQVWTIKDLAAGDKLSVVAEGFAKLDLTVP
jgi:hypothetical protein